MIYISPYKTDDPQIVYSQLAKEDGVIIFGTGNCGAIAQLALKEANINVVALSDNNMHRWGTKIDGVEVIPPEQIKSDYGKLPVLIAVDLNFPYIRKQLNGLGITNVFDCDFVFSKLDIDLKKCEQVTWSETKFKQKIDLYMYSVLAHKNKDKTLRVDSIDLMLTEKCSLKCKDCANLMQLYAKPIDQDFDILIKSIDKFLNTVDHCREIRLLGGEPMMYKKVDLVAEHILKFKNFDQLKINTNGTIIPNEKKIKVFQDERVFFDISNYGKISRNVEGLVKLLEEKKIAHNAARVTEWQDVGKIVKTNRTEQLNKEIFGNCCINRGITLLHGKLYLCPFSANATNLKAIKYADEEILNIDMYSKEELIKKIHKLYFKTDFLEACKSCNGRDHNVKRVEAALQASEPIKYEVVA
jgi:molybdenum cofactor biosynthesis enzyme MoaA